MRTNFTQEQRSEPATREMDAILRRCVHCGMCNTTCPTFLETGDERDSPRGRIYMIKDMLETGEVSSDVVHHTDRCLSCLACMTVCPSGVDYASLIDTARVHIQTHGPRPLAERALRTMLRVVVPNPVILRMTLVMMALWRKSGLISRALAALLPPRVQVLLQMVPDELPLPSSMDAPHQLFPAVKNKGGEGHHPQKRVLLMQGCVGQVLRPRINEATIRVLTHLGCEVVTARSTCCGALAAHGGESKTARAYAQENVLAWQDAEARFGPVDAVVYNTSGCGSTLQDYGLVLADDPDLAVAARSFAARMRDLAALCLELLPEHIPEHVPEHAPEHAEAPKSVGRAVVYHPPCSLQHGLRGGDALLVLLKRVGFNPVLPAESHLCCGSAGTYSITQPDMAHALGTRKAAHLNATAERVAADIACTSNIGCMHHLAKHTRLPLVHWIELLSYGQDDRHP